MGAAQSEKMFPALATPNHDNQPKPCPGTKYIACRSVGSHHHYHKKKYTKPLGLRMHGGDILRELKRRAILIILCAECSIESACVQLSNPFVSKYSIVFSAQKTVNPTISPGD